MHLLKEKTKDVPQSRKRRKVTVYGEGNEEQKHEEKLVPAFHTTNVIGNVEDSHNEMSMATPSKPLHDPNQQRPFDHRELAKHSSGLGAGPDEEMFKAITPQRSQRQAALMAEMASRRNPSKERKGN